MKEFYIKISKFLAYILRHDPGKFHLQLDSEGYADLTAVLKILNSRYQDKKITKELIEKIILESDKRRFEIVENKIRAYYGHSLKQKIMMREAEILPPFLFHGTTKRAYERIIKEGLKSENRQYVHLSGNLEDAVLVGKRRTNNPIILKINTKTSKEGGITFYKSGDLYLTNYIPPHFIKKIEERDK
ncbi:MAG: RNA 2'-phosphotransferase [Candidatus Hodarchaeota archaeon]